MEGSSGHFWPGSSRSAVLAVPVILVSLIILLLVVRELAGWPGKEQDGVVLIGILILSLLPVLLLLLGGLVGGGSVEAFGVVAIRFPEAHRMRQQVTVPPRMGLGPGTTLTSSGTVQILGALKAAAGSDVAVVDLEDGTAWWETRLLLLCVGAARLGRPRAIVFVATTGGVGDGAFKGWGLPTELLDILLTRRPELRRVYDRAAAITRQWELAPPPEANQQVVPPAAVTCGSTYGEHVFPLPGRERNSFAPEQVLAAELGELEAQGQHGVLTANRLNDLFEPVLRRVFIDLDSGPDTGERWEKTVLDGSDAFVALAHGHRYAGLLSREQAINDILSAILDRPAERAPV